MKCIAITVVIVFDGNFGGHCITALYHYHCS